MSRNLLVVALVWAFLGLPGFSQDGTKDEKEMLAKLLGVPLVYVDVTPIPAYSTGVAGVFFTKDQKKLITYGADRGERPWSTPQSDWWTS